MNTALRRPIVNVAALALFLAACQGSASPGGSVPPGESGEPLGGTISILATWVDTEEENFRAMIEPWLEDNGVELEYTGSRDLVTLLTTRVEGDDPPDLAGLPNPGGMAEFARSGDALDLSGVIDTTALAEEYDQGWINAGTLDGTFVGIYVKVSPKGLIWYNPAAFSDAGYEVPTDWDGFDALVEQIRDDGTTPWGVGLESGGDSGWPGTDWIEDFVIRQSGPDVYDQWVAGELAWSSDEIRAAFEAFGAWAADPDYVAGGPQVALSDPFGNGGDCLFDDPPGCYLHHQAGFMSSFFETNYPDVAVAGETYDFFPMPGAEFSGATASGDIFGMFTDTPQARSLLQYLVTPDAQQIWVELGGATSANSAVPLDAYPDDTSRRIAEGLQNAEDVRYDAGDLMPAQMGSAFFDAILQYVQDPDNLDQILSDLDEVQAEAYGQ
jgi:alpha-glucoside transport system substrate-binding protein